MKKEGIVKMAKFAFTGGLNTLVDFAVFSLFAELVGINVYAAQALGYAAGTINSYTINRKWTFESKQKYLSSAFIKFIFLNVAMLLLSVWLLAFFKEQMAMDKYIAKIFATIITMAISFIINNFVIFSGEKPTNQD